MEGDNLYITDKEKRIIQASPIYIDNYANTQWSSITTASVLAHLDAVTKTSVENLPLIKFLSMVYDLKSREDIDADTATMVSRQTGMLYGVGAPFDCSRYLREAGITNFTGSVPSIYHDEFTATLAAGGTLASTSILAAVASVTHYVEKIDIHLSMHSAIPSGSGIVTVEDEDANLMGYGAISNEGPHLVLECLTPAAADNKAVHLKVEAGGVHLNASKLYGQIYTRRI